jgi:hypothetical protein
MSEPCEQIENVKEIEKRLNKGELIFSEVARDIKQLIEDVSHIKEQTTRTNGRVTKLERLKTNFFYLMIGVAVCSADGPAVLKAIIEVIK